MRDTQVGLSSETKEDKKVARRLKRMEESLAYHSQGIHSSYECFAYMKEQMRTLEKELTPRGKLRVEEAEVSIAEKRMVCQ